MDGLSTRMDRGKKLRVKNDIVCLIVDTPYFRFETPCQLKAEIKVEYFTLMVWVYRHEE